MKALVWFRSDLRTDDNPALRQAFKEAESIEAIFSYSENQLNNHNEANVKVDFLIQHLFSLEKTLSSYNVPLTIIKSNGFDEDPVLIEKYCLDRSIEKVFWNNQFGEDESLRDKKVLEALESKGISVETFHDQVIYMPGYLKTGQGNPYSVFTPFKRKWVENFQMDFLDIDFQYVKKNPQDISSNISTFDFNYSRTHQVDMSLWGIGESAAEKRLHEFLDEKVMDYSKNRNDPILEGTSRISPYLALGIISPRTCILEALKINNFEFTSGNTGITKWIDEIVWREFYKNIMFSFPKVSRGQPFQDYSKKIKWRYCEEEFKAWKEGKTGFPIVDAAMRQIRNEGWMHNRLRMVVAMFFTKNMLHDWRLGEAYFMQNLIDGDFASNNGGWQWSSSTGTDAAPYFRIFNPILQGEKFDPDGLYTTNYIPELKSIPIKYLQKPWEYNLGLEYISPIVDYKFSRERALIAYQDIK